MVSCNASENNCLFSNSFCFNRETYKYVFYLHMRPHEVVPGLEMIFCGFLVSFVGLIFFGFEFSTGDIIANVKEYLPFYIFFLILFVFYGLLQFFYGFKMTFGLRKPKWGTERWNLRELLTMEKLNSTSTATPVFAPCVVDFYVSISAISFRFMGGWLTTTWDNTPYLYDEIPYLVPTKKELSPTNPDKIPEFINFSTTFFEDYFLKGHSDKTEYKYGDIFDIVEYKKVPDYALIRMNDEETEILIKKDAFNGDSWAEVKEFILSKQEEQKKLIKQEKKKNRKKRFKHD